MRGTPPPPPKRFYPFGDPPIVFKEKAEHLNPDHDDALVVSLKIVNTLVKKILVDIESSVDILYNDAVLKIGLNTKDLQPISSTLIGFLRDSITLWEQPIYISPSGRMIAPR